MSLPFPPPMIMLVSVVMGAWRELVVLAGAELDVVPVEEDVVVTSCGGVRCTK